MSMRQLTAAKLARESVRRTPFVEIRECLRVAVRMKVPGVYIIAETPPAL